MATIQQLEIKLNKKFNNLTIEELKKLIKKLTQDYYKTFLNNDSKHNETIFNNFNLLASKYPQYNINEFINYCLLLEVHKILNSNIKTDAKLKVFEVDLKEYDSNLKHISLCSTLETYKKPSEEEFNKMFEEA